VNAEARPVDEARAQSERTSSADGGASILRAGLDTLDFGFAIFERDLRLVTCNKAFRLLRGYPAALCKPGSEIVDLYRFNAKRGDYGPGDAEIQAQTRLVRVRARQPDELEYVLPSGQMLSATTASRRCIPFPVNISNRDALIRRSCVGWPSTGITVKAMSMRWWRSALRACVIRAMRRSRIGIRMGACMRSIVGERGPAAR